MEIAERVKDDNFIISISGRLDTVASNDLAAKLDNLITGYKPKIIINLATLYYIGSAGLKTLLVAFKKQRLNQGQLGLSCLQPFVINIFRITGFDKLFPIYLTEEAAVQEFTYGRGKVA